MSETLKATPEDYAHAWYRAQKSMAWFGPGERVHEYHGELFELGFGIPRKVPKFGFRSAVWHFCFGYMSGFPVSHIIYWVATRCFIPALNRRIIAANRRRIEAGEKWTTAS